MLPSDMNVKIRSGTAGYNNKILVSDGKFSLGKMLRLNQSSDILQHSQNRPTGDRWLKF